MPHTLPPAALLQQPVLPCGAVCRPEAAGRCVDRAGGSLMMVVMMLGAALSQKKCNIQERTRCLHTIDICIHIIIWAHIFSLKKNTVEFGILKLSFENVSLNFLAYHK